MISEENRAAFLDRDGVINIDYGYVHKWKDFHFCEGAIEGLKILLSLNFKIIIITNQSGIARGIFSERQYLELTKKYLHELKQKKRSKLRSCHNTCMQPKVLNYFCC